MPKVVFTCDECGFESYYKHGSCPDCAVKQLRAIVAKLPKTADGVAVVPGIDCVYVRTEGMILEVRCTCLHLGSEINACYSTREAAEAARETT